MERTILRANLSMHVVLVDSSRVVLKIIAGQLASRGHKVELFTDSAQALAFVAATPSVRVLVTSLELSPITGLELCRALRAFKDARRPLYVLAMSSARSDRNLVEALDSGADDFMDKPPGPEELYARLRVAERLTSLQQDLLTLAETDPLTGLLNRRAFFARAAAAERAGHARLSAIACDIDHFKRVNDGHGHAAGDAAIRAVAETLARDGEDAIVGRLGGEEFALVLPDRGSGQAEALAERLRLRIEGLPIPGPTETIRITCSFGLSARRVDEPVESLLTRADGALYAAKAAGRNRVVAVAA